MQTDLFVSSQVYKSVYLDQDDILRAIVALHCPDGFDADISYGNGAFYSAMRAPALKFDIDPQATGVVQASSDCLPLDDSSINSVVFDPPFLTYVRAGREGNGKMIMARRFAGYWTYKELEKHYRATLKECARVLKKKGVLVFKCQDIIHNHKMHCTHANVIKWAAEHGLSLLDLPAARRLPAPNRKGKQKHARIFHSYFLVLQC